MQVDRKPHILKKVESAEFTDKFVKRTPFPKTAENKEIERKILTHILSIEEHLWRQAAATTLHYTYVHEYYLKRMIIHNLSFDFVGLGSLPCLELLIRLGQRNAANKISRMSTENRMTTPWRTNQGLTWFLGQNESLYCYKQYILLLFFSLKELHLETNC